MQMVSKDAWIVLHPTTDTETETEMMEGNERKKDGTRERERKKNSEKMAKDPAWIRTRSSRSVSAQIRRASASQSPPGLLQGLCKYTLSYPRLARMKKGKKERKKKGKRKRNSSHGMTQPGFEPGTPACKLADSHAVCKWQARYLSPLGLFRCFWRRMLW